MQKGVLLLKTHFPAISLAALTALLVASPLFIVPLSLGNSYRGINIMEFGNDEHLYLTRGKEALEGKHLGQPFLAEGKDEEDITHSYVEYVLTAPLRALHLQDSVDIVSYYNFLNGVGIFALVLLMYALGLRLSGNTWLALGGAIFAVGGYPIIEAKTFFFEGLNIYGRSVYPFASSIPFFLFLNLSYAALIQEKGIRYVLGAGALFGALFYIYLYAWTFALAFLGAFGLSCIFLREWKALQNAFYIGAIGVSLGSYNLFQLSKVATGAYGKQLSYFYFSVFAHTPVMSKIGAATAGLFGAVLWKGERDRSLIFIAALIAAGWIALNQQVITGRMLQYGHYYWYFVVPLSVIIGSVLLARLISSRYATHLGIALILLGTLNLGGEQWRATQKVIPVKMHEQEYAPILATLNTLPYGVVLSDGGGDAYSTLITIYTDKDLEWTPSAQSHKFDIDALRRALLLHLFLNKDARTDPRAYLEKALPAYASRSKSNEVLQMYFELEGFYSGLDYYAYRDAIFGGNVPAPRVREELLKSITAEYVSFDTGDEVRSYLKSAGVRYVLWNRELNPEWDLFALRGRELLSHGKVTLYELD